jgi:murein DD-endopeptidase MepM/ murein hydrolase activator NlpD
VVVIRHPNGLETLYAHLSQRKVKPGDYLQAGQLLGLGGNTGRSYGAHLHFEIRYLGEPINPNKVLDVQTMSLKSDEVELVKKDFDHSKLVGKSDKSKSKKFHTVKSGETLTSIARKHKTSVRNLCKLNGISEKKVIRPGQKIRYK